MKHAFGLTIPQTVEDAIDLESTALVIYDMQVGIMRQLKDGGEVLTKVANVLEVARAVGLRTFFLRHTSLPKNLMGISQLRQALAWQRKDSVDDVHPWFLRDSPGHAIVPELTPLESEAVFDKIGMSAFEGPRSILRFATAAFVPFSSPVSRLKSGSSRRFDMPRISATSRS